MIPSGMFLPSPVLRPTLDYDVCASVPKIRPAELTTSLDGDVAVLVREDEPATVGVAPIPFESNADLLIDLLNQGPIPWLNSAPPPRA